MSTDGNFDTFSTGFVAPKSLRSAVISGLEKLEQQHATSRIWEHDASLWKSDPAVQQQIRDRLGWLTVANTMQEKRSEISALVDKMRQEGYKYAVLCGMGGSSLCPEVLRLTFGVADGYLNLFVLDTTDPDTILSVEQQIDLKTTLFIIASKSGKTLETLSQFKYFFDKVEASLAAAAQNDLAGSHFVAITDPGTSLEQLAHEHGFRHVFSNPPDIGGRYSALSFFGLVPGALIGVDIEQLLVRAQQMMGACGEGDTEKPHNPGLDLGAILGVLGAQGRNKVTFIISSEISSYGLWVEQLIAESTGKEGRGLLPVAGEQPGTPQDYGDDRLFVYLKALNDINDNSTLDKVVQTLQDAGQPVVHLDLQNRYDLGGEFFRWEFATAVAGHFLDINPFNEPNVQESKDNTNRILDQYKQDGKLPEPKPVASDGNITAYGGPQHNTHSLSDYLHTFLGQVRPADYIAIMAYVQPTEATEAALESLRTYLRDHYKVATTIGYGPRFLHSTGQLHKGGANNGVFIQITGDIQQDVAIPGDLYTFGTLMAAQALGDLYSLENHQRRVIRLHIAGNTVQGLQRIKQIMLQDQDAGGKQY